jgi:hypothetical protein
MRDEQLPNGGTMKARYMLESPETAEATMKITMTVKEWEDFRDQLQNKWPSSRLSSAVTSMLSEARRVVYAPEKDAFS